METRLFCPKCDSFETVDIRIERESYPVKNEDIEIMAKVSYCTCCGEQVWNEDCEEENLLAAYNEYRKRHGLLMPEEIRAIREKYGLSQALFSKVLGLGEKTITRYENGSIQDAAHNGLVALSGKPDAFSYLLDLNKNMLTDREYCKVSNAIAALRVSIIEPVRSFETCYSVKTSEYKIEATNRYWGGLSDAS